MIPADLADLVRAGLSDREIADRCGVSARTVLRWRKRRGLPSMWTPERAACGTPAGYARPCRCGPCRSANTEQHRRTMAVYAALTRYAPASSMPWTPQDDEALLQGPGSLLERAQRLGRTYVACELRLTAIRKELVDA